MARFHATSEGPVPFTPEEEAERDAEEAAWLAGENDRLAATARERRNALLAQSDWTQGKDVPDAVSTPWTVYRVALRDVPQQPGFPLNIVWPTPPGAIKE